MNLRVELAEMGCAHMSNNEQGVFNDVGEFQLKASSIPGTFTSFRNYFLTLADCTAASRSVTSPIHSALPIFFPILHPNAQYARSATHNIGNERGGKNLIGHTVREIGTDPIDVPCFDCLLEFFGELAFAGHIQGVGWWE